MAEADQVAEMKARIRDLKTQLVESKEGHLPSIGKARELPLIRLALRARRRLEGHFGKIYAFAWGPDSEHLVTASQDGNMFTWNALYGLKMQGITLPSAWVMTCGYAPSGNMVATAGLDNVVWIYPVEEGATEEVMYELAGHEGYISSCSFLDDQKMLTTSGDCTAAIWDIPNRRAISEFAEHTLDVNCSALAKGSENNVFVTGSCDGTTKIWDARAGTRSQRTFIGHESDVNAVAFFPDDNCFVSGSDDSTCRLFDIRSYSMLNCFVEDQHFSGVTSTAVSASGKYVFTAYDTGPVYVWDTVFAETVQFLEGHQKRVSKVRVAPNGSAVATASWDTSCIVWA